MSGWTNTRNYENHMVLPAADPEAFYGSGYSDPDKAKVFCTWCEQEIYPRDFQIEEEGGWIHRSCLDHRREEEAGFSILAFSGFVIAAYIAIVLFVHLGLRWSGR